MLAGKPSPVVTDQYQGMVASRGRIMDPVLPESWILCLRALFVSWIYMFVNYRSRCINTFFLTFIYMHMLDMLRAMFFKNLLRHCHYNINSKAQLLIHHANTSNHIKAMAQ